MTYKMPPERIVTTIRDVKLGETWYTSISAVVVDSNHDVWLDSDFAVDKTDSSRFSTEVQLQLTAAGIELWISEREKFFVTDVSEEVLPVAKINFTPDKIDFEGAFEGLGYGDMAAAGI